MGFRNFGTTKLGFGVKKIKKTIIYGYKGDGSAYVDVPLILDGTYDVETSVIFDKVGDWKCILDFRADEGNGYLVKGGDDVISTGGNCTAVHINNEVYGFGKLEKDTRYNIEIQNMNISCTSLKIMATYSGGGVLIGRMIGLTIKKSGTGQVIHQFNMDEKTGSICIDSVDGINGTIMNANLADFHTTI